MTMPSGEWRDLAPRGEPAYAHTPNTAGDWHHFGDHARVVGELAAGFAASFGGGSASRVAGYAHDTGKLAAEVQAALRMRAFDGGRKLGVPHKGEGAILAVRGLTHPYLQAVVSLAISGHHHEIPYYAKDPMTLRDTAEAAPERAEELVERVDLELEGALRGALAAATLPAYLIDPGLEAAQRARELDLFVRMVHSALVDADFLDTAAHFRAAVPREHPKVGMERLRNRFMAWYLGRYGDAPMTDLNRLRREVFDRCVEIGQSVAPGRGGAVYRLPAQTGSGKTMAAAAFALNHAAAFGKERVIVAVPFTSITTQNAAEYRAAFDGLDSKIVLEHHSNILDPELSEDAWRRLSAENWDAEFIVTTTVQLFESLFSGTPSAARKLHRIANSVLVLDEIQALPIPLLPTILGVLRQLAEHYGVTVLLASATQPSFWQLEVWRDLPCIDVLPVDRVPPVTRRVAYDIRTSAQPWEEIVDEIAENRQALTIVNSTGDAQHVHALLQDIAFDRPILHLSTRMCGQHRLDVLAAARRLLAADEPLLVVSTQLIEAGVDVDFPKVFRAMAPAESLIQSAGRCNREGSLGIRGGTVVVFEPVGGHMPAGHYGEATKVARDLFVRRGKDLTQPQELAEYYRQVYRTLLRDGSLRGAIDDARRDLNFPEVRQQFRMIDDRSVGVIVTDYGSRDDRIRLTQLLDDLRRDRARVLSPAEWQLLQRFTATVPRSYALGSALIEPLPSGLSVWAGEYDPDCGVVLESSGTIW